MSEPLCPIKGTHYDGVVESEGITFRINQAEKAAILRLDIPIRNKLTAICGNIENFLKQSETKDGNAIDRVLAQLQELEEYVETNAATLDNEDFDPLVRELAPLFQRCADEALRYLQFLAQYKNPEIARISLTEKEAAEIIRNILDQNLREFIVLIKNGFERMDNCDEEGFLYFLESIENDKDTCHEVILRLNDRDLFRLIMIYRRSLLTPAQKLLADHPAYKVFRSVTNETERSGHSLSQTLS
jgi:hypothetical protein